MRVSPKEVLIAVVALMTGIAIAAILSSGKPVVALFQDPRYAVVWSGIFGAVIASGLSLWGVNAANKSSETRLHAQHVNDAAESEKQRAHDAIQKDEDRKAAIRREVYTKAVEEVHAVLASIGGIPERLWSERSRDADALQAFLKANAKVWLVAEAKAAHLSRELTNLMSELYFKTLLAARELRQSLEPLHEINRQIEHFESEVKRTDVKLAESKEQIGQEAVLQAVHDSHTQARDLVAGLRKQRDEVVERIRAPRFAHATAMFDDMQLVQSTLVKLVSALRAELHLPPDEEEFLRQQKDMATQALAALYRAFGQDPPVETGPPSDWGSHRG